jgi:hypothetical protein
MFAGIAREVHSVNVGEAVKANPNKLTVISEVRDITRERQKRTQVAEVTYTRDLKNGSGICERYDSQQKFRAFHEFKEAIEERQFRRQKMWVNLIK